VRGPGHQECLDDCLTCWLMRGDEDDVTWLGSEGNSNVEVSRQVLDYVGAKSSINNSRKKYKGTYRRASTGSRK
jgi:hypothetical protein